MIGKMKAALHNPVRRTEGHTLRVAPDQHAVVWPLHNAAATRHCEQAALALHPQPALMARAGLALAQLGRALAPNARQTWVLAGPGNNGGDGLVAARWLHSARHLVHVRLVADPARLPADAARALRLAASAGVDIQPFKPDEETGLGPQDLAIDALLGIGSQRAPQGDMAQAIAMLNGSSATRLAVDLPSGLHPDTGTLLGNRAVHAHATLALLTIKPGCLTSQGRDHAGQLWWNDLNASIAGPSACLGAAPLAPARRHAAHKGSFGDVWVLGGSKGMEGALVLAAEAALAAGAGRVYACPLNDDERLHCRPELMRRPIAQALQPALLSQATVVVGCGGGSAVAAVLPALLSHAARLVLDADALNVIAASHPLQDALRARARQQQATVLTPHPLEAARLLACPRDSVQGDRIAAAQQLAHRFQAVVVLKGSGTVITCPDALLWINPTGNAALGTAGTGDVLAGWLGGMWAQTASTPVEPASTNAFKAARVAQAAVWWHGHAADQWIAQGRHGSIRAADLIEQMSQA